MFVLRQVETLYNVSAPLVGEECVEHNASYILDAMDQTLQFETS